MNHVRVIRLPSGRYGLVTAFLGNPLNRVDLAAAGIGGHDPQDLAEADAKRIAVAMDRWIDGQNSQARKAKEPAPQKQPQNTLRI